jgi:hypothetical protein
MQSTHIPPRGAKFQWRPTGVANEEGDLWNIARLEMQHITTANLASIGIREPNTDIAGGHFPMFLTRNV